MLKLIWNVLLVFIMLTLPRPYNAQERDETQDQITNFNEILDTLDSEIRMNYWVISSLDYELGEFSKLIPRVVADMASVKAYMDDMVADFAQVNKTNQIWANNFKLMDKAFAQLKKKYNIKGTSRA